jgi:hypothetical protein
VSDQCGSSVHCGDCGAGDVCLATGTCCHPATCQSEPCGYVGGDGCGNMLSCPACSSSSGSSSSSGGPPQ